MPTVTLSSLFSTVKKDKRITVAEVSSLTRNAKADGKVTKSEHDYLARQSALYKDQFVAAAHKQLLQFLAAEAPKPAQRDLTDPPVLGEDKSSVKYAWMKGQLFVDGVNENDVKQGSIGNCYLVGAFAAVAAQDPNAIKNAIKDNKDGTYTVRLFQTSAFSRTPIEKKYVIDGQLPMANGVARYAKSTNPNELWVSLLEKAFAMRDGSYGELEGERGALPGPIMAALTGRPSRYTRVFADSTGDRFFNDLKTALASKRTAAAITHPKDKQALYSGTGIHTNHTYSILGTEEVGGKKLIVMRNPWARSEPAGNGKDDGVFKIDLATFQKLFQGYCVS